MTWWGWILLGLYLVCALVAIRKIGWVVANSTSYREMEGDDIVFGLFVGVCSCAIWPLVWLGYRIHTRESGTDWSVLLSPPRDVRRARDLDAREQRIRQLEREMGIA